MNAQDFVKNELLSGKKPKEIKAILKSKVKSFGYGTKTTKLRQRLYSAIHAGKKLFANNKEVTPNV